MLVEAEMNSLIDDTDDLGATDATLVLNAAADCPKLVSTLLQSENNLSADQAECLSTRFTVLIR